jgi:hypothetical protein
MAEKLAVDGKAAQFAKVYRTKRLTLYFIKPSRRTFSPPRWG